MKSSFSVTNGSENATGIRQIPWIRLGIAAFCGFAWCLLAGCAYRFTNKHVVRPEGIETIAVEAIYDTSREVLPHELLWKSLQDAFAADGHLRLAPQSAADALVRAHLRKASVLATGSIGTPRDKEAERDPSPYDRAGPPRPEEFRELAKANVIRDQARMSLVVDVEVWSLRTKTKLLAKSYPVAGNFRTVHYSLPSSSLPNDHLRLAEANEAEFKSLSEGIARSLVRDLLVR